MTNIALKTVTEDKYFAISGKYNERVYLYVIIGGSITPCKGVKNLKVGSAYYGRIDFRRSGKYLVDYVELEHVSIRTNQKTGKGSDGQSEFQAIDEYLVNVKRRMVLEGIEPGSQKWEKGKDEAAELFAAINSCKKHVSKDTYIWKKLYNELFGKKNN